MKTKEANNSGQKANRGRAAGNAMTEAPYGTQPEVGDIMRNAIIDFDGKGTPIKDVVPCPTPNAPHKVKVRILADDTWITLWFGYTPWKLMQKTEPTPEEPT